MILVPEVLTILILNGIFLVFSTIAFVISLRIYKNWDRKSSTNLQYNLEKQSVLAGTIIKYIFLVKLPLFLFFIFTLDKISNVLIGAMCAAGVVDATSYGIYLFIFKILNLYLFGFWLVLNNIDIQNENLPYTKVKFGFFCVVYFLFLAEIIIEILMFSSIDPSIMVSCCGALYSSTSTSYISSLFTISPVVILSIFYVNVLALGLSYYFKHSFSYAIFALLFIIISIISLISWFGTYIYELPTHHCPFCFLQKDYYYIGYLIYFTLFTGTFFALITPFFNKKRYFDISIFFIIFYTLIVSGYPVVYYIKNGVWL